MKKKRNIFPFFLHVLFLLTVFVIQSLVFPYLIPLGIVPVILPLAVVGVAIFEGSFRGGIFGLFAGMLCDVSFNQPLILFTLMMTLVGLLVGVISDMMIAQGFPSFLVTSLIVLAIVAFAQMFSPLFFRGVPFPVLFRTALFQTLISAVFTLPMYFVARALGRSIQKNIRIL